MDPPGAEIANVTGAVLVGVPGRRLGAAKTTALVAERSLVSYPLAARPGGVPRLTFNVNAAADLQAAERWPMA